MSERFFDGDLVGWLAVRGWGRLLLRYWPRTLDPGFWRYLLSDLDDLPWFGRSHRLFGVVWYTSKWGRIVCRWRGHPHGEVYWNPGGDEPNHDCVDCGENIG